MSISIEYGPGIQVEFKQWQFPGGECGVQLDLDKLNFNVESFLIRWNYEGDSEMMAVAQIVDAIRRDKSQGGAKLLLNLPYLPYARQDRVCSPGESHALKVFSTWLNGLKFDDVCVLDPHSHVAEALVDNFSCWSQEEKFKEYLWCRKQRGCEGYDYLIAPDAGAAKKVENCRRVHEEVFGTIPKILVGHKVRQGDKVTVHVQTEGLDKARSCVVDDICDGGATFISLGGHIRSICEPEILDLYVSHGIFSNHDNLIIMVDDEKSIFDKIITPNLMNKKVSNYVTTF